MRSILSKRLTYLFLLIACSLTAQQDAKPSPKAGWQEYQRDYKYVRQKKYTGPAGSEYLSPPSMQEDVDEYDSYEGYSGGISYSPKDIRKARAEKRGETGAGSKPIDPDIQRPEPGEASAPEPAPSTAQPQPDEQVQVPFFSGTLLTILGVLLLLTLLGIIVYQLAKKQHTSNRRVSSDFSPEDWNPALIPKTELELRLEEALLRGDYRACVRIYFTFILKELIRLNHIKWRKELTNYDYWLQLQNRSGAAAFAESMRIYELVWYGDYEITEADFQEVAPHLEQHYQQLTNAHE